MVDILNNRRQVILALADGKRFGLRLCQDYLDFCQDILDIEGIKLFCIDNQNQTIIVEPAFIPKNLALIIKATIGQYFSPLP